MSERHHQQRLRQFFAGRGRELARITEAFGQTDVGAVAIVGEAGIGKTRLMTEALRHIDSEAHFVVRATATQATSGSPFAAFAAHVPAVLLSSPSDGYALNVAAEALLRSADDRRIVLAIDDIDHLDRASRSMAFHLAWRNEAFLMTTLRRDVAMPDPVASLWSGGSGEWIDLQPFHHHDVLELLAGVLHGQIDGFLGQRLWERTAGNPMLLRELIHAQLEAETLEVQEGLWRLNGPLAVPPHVAQLVEGRLRSLPEDSRHAVELVAFGDPVEVEVLCRLVPLAAIEDAEARGLVVLERRDEREYAALAYPLYGDAIRAFLPRVRAQSRSRELAGMAFDAAEATREAWCKLDFASTVRLSPTTRSGGGEAQFAERLAYSLMFLGRCDEAEAMCAGLGASAPEQDNVGAAMARAVNLYLGLGKRDAAQAVLAHDPACGEFAALAALFESLGGRYGDALRQAETLLSTPQSPRTTAMALVAKGLGLIFTTGEMDGSTALSAALERDPDLLRDLPWLALIIEIGMVHACLWSGHLAEADRRAGEAYRGALSLGWQCGIATFSMLRAAVAWMRGAVHDQISCCREAIAIARTQCPSTLLPVLLAQLAHAQALAGEPAAAREALAESDRVADRALPFLRPWMELARARVEGQTEGSASLLQVAHNARGSASAGFESLALHEFVRLGEAERVQRRLTELAQRCESRAARLFAAHARAVANHDDEALGAVSVDFERMGSPLLAAEAAALQSRCHRAAGRLNLASAAVVRALCLARECEGAQRIPALEALEHPQITPREQQIAQLAANGLSSKEISARFVLSVRTVDNHLQRVYRKLGIRTRAELAQLRGLFALQGVSPPG